MSLARSFQGLRYHALMNVRCAQIRRIKSFVTAPSRECQLSSWQKYPGGEAACGLGGKAPPLSDQIATRSPNSTTRSRGKWKKSVGSADMRARLA